MSFYFLKTTVCTGFGSTTESSAVFPAAAAVGSSSSAVPGSEDEVGGSHCMLYHVVCVCVKVREESKFWYNV